MTKKRVRRITEYLCLRRETLRPVSQQVDAVFYSTVHHKTLMLACIILISCAHFTVTCDGCVGNLKWTLYSQRLNVICFKA